MRVFRSEKHLVECLLNEILPKINFRFRNISMFLIAENSNIQLYDKNGDIS